MTCKDCGVSTEGSARCPSCWDDKCGGKSTEKRDRLAEEAFPLFTTFRIGEEPPVFGNTRRARTVNETQEDKREGFRAGFDAAQKESQGRIEELELTVKRLEDLLLEVKQIAGDSVDGVTARKATIEIYMKIARLEREALSREGKGET